MAKLSRILEKRLTALDQLGNVLSFIGQGLQWENYTLGITEEEFLALDSLVRKLQYHNGWFSEREVRRTCLFWGNVLKKRNLIEWIAPYDLDNVIKNGNVTVGIIMAGNIPAVGFHDFVCCYLVGCKMKLKLSSSDHLLIPAFIKILGCFDETIEDSLEIVETKLENFDVIIATGSNNTTRYFDYYFAKYPSIIRKSRTSVAIIRGNEGKEELKKLAQDVFFYYGLGCRNVTKVFLPSDYDLNQLFNAFYDFSYVMDNNKYANNYDYHKAIYLMEKQKLLENGFLLLKEDKGLHSPVGSLFYEYYDNISSVKQTLKMAENDIQCVVGGKEVPFGKAQAPDLFDYADHIDTLEFLSKTI